VLLPVCKIFVLFIHDDQAQRRDWGKDGRARASNNSCPALANFMPLIMALAGGQMAMQHCDERLQVSRTPQSVP
jgi:hypothetical protein